MSKIPWKKLDQEACLHPPEWAMYEQLNQPVADPGRITVADLCGGINPYVWRVEYCGACNKVIKTFGDVPERYLN
jgi:hypothetical protein